MANSFKETLYVNADNQKANNSNRENNEVTNPNIEQAYINQIRLKNDPEFMKMVINNFIEMATLFKKVYPNVTIEPPRGRIKSNKSIKRKIKNLEIERLCILYAVDTIPDSEKNFLKQAILELINGKNNMNQEQFKQIEQRVENVFDGKIENLENIEYIVKQKNLSEKAKTALLRITKARLQQENIPNSKELQDELRQISIMEETIDEKTGKKIFYDILKWKDIQEINPQNPNYEQKMQALHNPMEYLTLKDLIGMKIVVGNIPEDIKTDNEDIKTVLQIRKKVQEVLKEKKKSVQGKEELTENEKQEIKELEEQNSQYDEQCRVEIIKEFANILMDEKLLKKLNLKLEKYKSKDKENGYRAEHIKFAPLNKEHQEDENTRTHAFELQLRSIGCEMLARSDGVAGHRNRDGKESRDFDNVPEYFVLYMNREEGDFVPHICSEAENMEEFLRGYVDDEELDKKIEQKIEQGQR